MNKVYLSLGSNLLNRLENLKSAIKKLEENGIKIIKLSPRYDTSALMLKGSPIEWNKPFLNCVIKAQTERAPDDLLKIIKNIEKELGRDFSKKWAPRTIDIDILFFNDEVIDTENLLVPHKGIKDRAFVLDPLTHLCPYKKLDDKTILELATKHKQHQPLIMGIMNITPDSFSDGGQLNDKDILKEKFENWCDNGIHIIDIGAESTRPNAEVLTTECEIKRLKYIFSIVKQKSKDLFRPLFSIDTYHKETAKLAVQNGFDIVNDVSGLLINDIDEIFGEYKDEKMMVCMHSLTIPAKKDVVMDEKVDVIVELKNWINNKIEYCEKNNIKLENIIFDVGIGFGKNANQSLQLLQKMDEIKQKTNVKILVGHSRKSFMNIFSEVPNSNRDTETIAISLELCNKGVDILRVHEPVLHKRAIVTKQHMEEQFV
ncbi:dihydropteroate synthase [Pseudomonadota bacterium]